MDTRYFNDLKMMGSGVSRILRAEMQILQTLHQHSIVSQHETSEYTDIIFVKEQDLTSLKDFCKKTREAGKTLKEEDALRMFTPLMQALEVVHANGLIHRNIHCVHW